MSSVVLLMFSGAKVVKCQITTKYFFVLFFLQVISEGLYGLSDGFEWCCARDNGCCVVQAYCGLLYAFKALECMLYVGCTM